MSIESKKRLVTCLHLLKLANKQLSDKISCLQDLVEKEQVHPLHKQDGNARTTTGAGEDETSSEEDDDDEEFFDASEQVNASEQSIVVKMEVVGTVKKVYSLISKFTANSLPEPARSQVREIDSTLGKAEEWVKQKQEVKEMIRERFLQQQQQYRQQQQKDGNYIKPSQDNVDSKD
ncbi:AMM_1a_G0022950.mRNA.1.CDS.1 [Saccharomyces cerevisiae]|nr:AMM_1a_G0022950.mRNA.1.CDS.1 [Saccharomyces cerevisiae]CAI6698771.1 AMM_1a_G0022950.mRNA.1.CDS.1 [Saccharomyces cerevisiae]